MKRGLTALSSNPLVLILLINLFMIVIGILMDDVSAVLLSTPMLLPRALELGSSPIHFAAIVGVNLGLGNITPPTAPLFYLSGELCGACINESIPATLVLIGFAWMPVLLLTTYVPALSLWLPKLFLGIQ